MGDPVKVPVKWENIGEGTGTVNVYTTGYGKDSAALMMENCCPAASCYVDSRVSAVRVDSKGTITNPVYIISKPDELLTTYDPDQWGIISCTFNFHRGAVRRNLPYEKKGNGTVGEIRVQPAIEERESIVDTDVGIENLIFKGISADEGWYTAPISVLQKWRGTERWVTYNETDGIKGGCGPVEQNTFIRAKVEFVQKPAKYLSVACSLDSYSQAASSDVLLSCDPQGAIDWEDYKTYTFDLKAVSDSDRWKFKYWQCNTMDVSIDNSYSAQTFATFQADKTTVTGCVKNIEFWADFKEQPSVFLSVVPYRCAVLPTYVKGFGSVTATLTAQSGEDHCNFVSWSDMRADEQREYNYGLSVRTLSTNYSKTIQVQSCPDTVICVDFVNDKGYAYVDYGNANAEQTAGHVSSVSWWKLLSVYNTGYVQLSAAERPDAPVTLDKQEYQSGIFNSISGTATDLSPLYEKISDPRITKNLNLDTMPSFGMIKDPFCYKLWHIVYTYKSKSLSGGILYGRSGLPLYGTSGNVIRSANEK